MSVCRIMFNQKQLRSRLTQICRDAKTDEVVPARLWTSTMRRTMETAQFIPTPTISVADDNDPFNVIEWQQMRPRAWCNLDELYAGIIAVVVS